MTKSSLSLGRNRIGDGHPPASRKTRCKESACIVIKTMAQLNVKSGDTGGRVAQKTAKSLF